MVLIEALIAKKELIAKGKLWSVRLLENQNSTERYDFNLLALRKIKQVSLEYKVDLECS